MSLKKAASRTKSLSLSGDDFPLRPAKPRAAFVTAKRPEDTAKIMKYIDDSVIGKGVAFLGPFGRRKVVYADYASSGRSLQFLEDYINKEVLPAYGDISCISAVTGLQSHLYDNEARDLVRAAVGAGPEDEIVFCHNPAERLCFLLSSTASQMSSSAVGPPILFVSTSEPIANLKSWIDGGWLVERIVKNHEGFLDLVDLEKRLLQYSEGKRMMVGMFSGASRLTGILADDVATTILLHQYDALSIWDHSVVASCASIETNPVLPGAQKDAIFFHCSRMVGGVQAPGVLVIKKKLVENSVSFLVDTVGVVGAVRAGLVLQLKESLGVQAIMHRMEKICKQMLAHVRTIPEIALLGPPCTTAKRLTTLCFMVRHPRGAFLHHRFVVAVLNDAFGIQATADNMISDSLGINPAMAVEYEKVLNDESLKAASIHPGYIRVTFPFFMPEAEVAFILEAIKMVATEAWKLLPQYEVDDRTGEWRHHSNSLAKERKWLGAIRYTDGKMLFSDRRISGPGTFPQTYSDCLQTARNLFNRARKMAQRSSSEEIILKLPHTSVENLRWYMLPGEAHELLLGHSHNVKNTVPFDPTKIPENTSLLMIHRHHSLSALDIKRFKSRSLPASPLQISIRRQHSSSPQQSHSPTPTPTPTPTSSPPIVRFSLGSGEVTGGCCYSPPLQQHQQLTSLMSAHDNSTISRNRCNSWGSSPSTGRLNSSGNSNTNKTESTLVTSSSSVIGEGQDGSSGGGDGFCGDFSFLGPQTRLNLGLTLQKQQQQQQQVQHHQRQPSRISPTYARTASASEPRTLVVRPKQRSCSCSSQTDLSIDSSENLSTAVAMATDGFQPVGSSFSSESAENIQAYVKEVTKELATEIKSEIREVISKVEDVLESTDSLDMSGATFSSLGNVSFTNDNKRDSISASDVVDYLKEFSKGMMNDVKSEIRDVVNSMDEIYSPDGMLGARKNSPPDILRSNTAGPKLLIKHQRHSDVTPESYHRPKSADIDKHRSESFPRPSGAVTTSMGPPSQIPMPSPAFPYTGAIAKSLDLRSSMSSQDSGINMCFSDPDEKLRSGKDRNRTISAQLEESSRADKPQRRVLSESGAPVPSGFEPLQDHTSRLPTTPEVDVGTAPPSKLIRQPNVLKSSPSQDLSEAASGSSSVTVDGGVAKWHNLPRDIWKQAAEALDDFGMLKEGDRVLVCLSGSSSSLCLLHLLRQFVRARHLANVTLATVSFGDCGVDPRALMLYLRELKVDYFYEQTESTENLQDKLVAFASRKSFNVLALANTLDKLADRFLMSLLYQGKLHTTQAIITTQADEGQQPVRLIRPLLYLRERALEDFAGAVALPSRPSRLFTRPPDVANSILRVQEAANPAVYGNIRSALKPLLALRVESTKSTYESVRAALVSRD